jgi:hypothetical protein
MSWYYNKDLKPQGPFPFEEMKRKILRGEVGPHELIFKDGARDWMAAAEWVEFPKELFPAFQKNLFRGINPHEKEWTLLLLKPGATAPVQEGPYSLNEIRELIVQEKAGPEDYIWRTGLTGWLQIQYSPLKDPVGGSGPLTSPEL